MRPDQIKELRRLADRAEGAATMLREALDEAVSQAGEDPDFADLVAQPGDEAHIQPRPVWLGIDLAATPGDEKDTAEPPDDGPTATACMCDPDLEWQDERRRERALQMAAQVRTGGGVGPMIQDAAQIEAYLRDGEPPCLNQPDITPIEALRIALRAAPTDRLQRTILDLIHGFTPVASAPDTD